MLATQVGIVDDAPTINGLFRSVIFVKSPPFMARFVLYGLEGENCGDTPGCDY